MKTLITLLILICLKLTVTAQENFEFEGIWSAKSEGDIIQLDISKPAPEILVQYTQLYEGGEEDNYAGMETKLLNPNELAFKMDIDGDTCNCVVILSEDKQFIDFQATTIDGYQEIRLKKQ